jgi:hypothetical protein
MIVHRVRNNQQDNHHFQQIYPRQYFHERNQNYAVSVEKHRDIQSKYGKIFPRKKLIIMDKMRDMTTFNNLYMERYNFVLTMG